MMPCILTPDAKDTFEEAIRHIVKALAKLDILGTEDFTQYANHFSPISSKILQNICDEIIVSMIHLVIQWKVIYFSFDLIWIRSFVFRPLEWSARAQIY